MDEKFAAVVAGKLICFFYHKNMGYLKEFIQDPEKFHTIEELLDYAASQEIKAYIQKPGFSIAEAMDYRKINKIIEENNMQMSLDELKLLKDSMVEE